MRDPSLGFLITRRLKFEDDRLAVFDQDEAMRCRAYLALLQADSRTHNDRCCFIGVELEGWRVGSQHTPLKTGARPERPRFLDPPLIRRHSRPERSFRDVIAYREVPIIRDSTFNWFGPNLANRVPCCKPQIASAIFLTPIFYLIRLIGYPVPYNWFGPNLVPIKSTVPYNWHLTVLVHDFEKQGAPQ